MFFAQCKMLLESRADYLAFTNHFYDLTKKSPSVVGVEEGLYPLYVIVNESMDVDYTYDKKRFKSGKGDLITLEAFLNKKYIISEHFRERFRERFEDSSDSRCKKLVKNILKQGKWMKRKDSIQAMKYNKTSDYVLYSRTENMEKVYYLIVLTNENILTTIYEFDIKDMKFFKET